MSTRKYLGRLAGNNPPGLDSTAPISTVTPFSAQATAAKFRSYGEGATAEQHNRALSAIQQNIEDGLNTFDAPTVARARIMAKLSTFGSKGLEGVLHGSTAIDLGAVDGADTDSYPVQWVYCGLHKADVARYVRAYRYPDGTADEYAAANPSDVNRMLVALPTAVLTQGDVDFFSGDANYLTSSPHAPVDRIPPLQHAVGPGDTEIGLVVASWERDGPLLASGHRVDQAYGRVGCFVSIEDGENKGIYRICAISRKEGAEKLVLSTGGLHRIDVAHGDGNAFAAGALVSWNNDANTAPRAQQYGYIAAIRLGADAQPDALYVADMPGEEDYVSVVGTDGQKVGNGGALQFGAIGLFEAEVGATQNASLVVGSTITQGYGSASAVITAIRPAGYPFVFATNPATLGTAYVMGPLGFVLNPKLQFDGAHASGNYLVECKTLTTVREKLASLAGPSRITQNIDADIGFSDQDVQRLKAFARYVKTGEKSASDRGTGALTLLDAFTAPAQLLGENAWRLTITAVTSDTVPAGSITKVHAISGGTTRATVVSASSTEVLLCDVSTADWSPAQLATAWADPIETGGTFTDGTHTFNVTAVAYRPAVLAHDATAFVPRGGLQGAYDAAFDAAALARGKGMGSQIVLTDARPFQLLKRAASTNADFISLVSGGVLTDQVWMLKWDGPASHGAWVGASNVTGALLLTDSNTPGWIEFSSAVDTALPAALPQNLLGAIKGEYQASVAVSHMLGVQVLSGATVTSYSNTITVAAGTYLVEGIVVAKAEAVLTIADAFVGDVGMVVCTSAGDVVAWEPTRPVGVAIAPIAQFILTRSDGHVDSISLRDLRQLPSGQQGRQDLTVGEGGNYTTLGDAIAFLNTYAAAGGTRQWRVLVVGDTTEPDTITPWSGNITIEGVGNPRLSWAGDQALFDLNGQANITIRGIECVFTGSTTLAALSRVAFTSGATGLSNVLLEDVRVSATHAMLHGHVMLTDTTADVSLVRCHFEGATEFGVVIKHATRARLLDCYVCAPDSYVLQDGAHGGLGGVLLGEPATSTATDALVRDCVVLNWRQVGVLVCGPSGQVTGTRTSVGTVGGSAHGYYSGVPVGVYAGVSTLGRILNCFTSGNGVDACYGVYVAGTCTHVIGCDTRLASCGIVLADAATYAILDQNQTNGHGITLGSGTTHSIGGLNRDDA